MTTSGYDDDLGDAIPETIGGPALAAVLGVSLRTVSRMIDRGTVVRLRPGVYAFAASVRNHCDCLRAAKEAAGGAGGKLTDERARLAHERANGYAIRNELLRAEHVLAADVDRTWGEIVRKVRASILAVPSRLGQVLPGLTASEVVKIDRELRDALEALGRGDD